MNSNKLSVNLARKYVIESYKDKINEIKGMTKEQILRSLNENQLKELNDLANAMALKTDSNDEPADDLPNEAKPAPKPRGRKAAIASD